MKNNRINSDNRSADTINRNSYEPAYAQIANILHQQIDEGLFRPGDQLPSESQLCHRFKVSPMTVRRSINLLVDRDLVDTAQGRGTFVKPLELGTATFDLQSLQKLFSNEPGTVVKILDVRVIPADEYIARELDLNIGEKTIYIRRLLIKNGDPIAYHREHLVYDPTRPIVEAEMNVISLQGVFTGIDNTLIKWGRLTVKSALMNKEEASLLKVSLPAAAFCVEHLFYDFDNRPTTTGWFVCHSDHLQITTNVGR